MVIVSSGAISLYDIQTEFGGFEPISLSEYYNNGTYVKNVTGIPSSGVISMSNFYGKEHDPLASIVEIYENGARVKPTRIGTTNDWYYTFTVTFSSSPINTIKFLKKNVNCTILVVGSGFFSTKTTAGEDRILIGGGGAGGWIEYYTNYTITQNTIYYFFVAPGGWWSGGYRSSFSSANSNTYPNINYDQSADWDGGWSKRSTICNVKTYNNTTQTSTINYESFYYSSEHTLQEIGGSGGGGSSTNGAGGSGYMCNITGVNLEYSRGGNSSQSNYPVPPYNDYASYFFQPYWNTTASTSTSGYGTGGSVLRYLQSVGQCQGCIIVRFTL